MKRWMCFKCGTYNQLRDEEARILLPTKGLDYCQKCGWHPNESRYIVDEHGKPL